MPTGSPEADRLAAARLIIVDECSMMPVWQIELIDQLLRTITGNKDVLFGGKTFLLGGDMRQILPVVRGVSPTEAVEWCLSSWRLWTCRTQLTLTVNQRANSDPDFCKWLMSVRDGTANVSGTDDIVIPNHMVLRVAGQGHSKTRKIDLPSAEEKKVAQELIKKVYGNMTLDDFQNGIILSPTNDSVWTINNVALQSIAATQPIRTYYSNTSVVLSDDAQEQQQCNGFVTTAEELCNLRVSNLPPHCLQLCVGAIVMLMRNLNKRQGLCNGTRFAVTGIFKDTICVRRLKAFRGKREEIFLPRMSMRSDDVPVAGTVCRIQYPLCLAFAMTINKSQGQGFQIVRVYLKRPVFSHGQFYVAVSRCKNGQKIYIVVVRGPHQGPVAARGGRNVYDSVKTKNIVTREVLE